MKRKDAATIPIIASTADAFDDIYAKIKDAGMNERLIKPIDANLLCFTIIRLCEERQQSNEYNLNGRTTA